jgi:acetylornithine/succinyldiaminopimelate/putrescine aminotransferase
MWFPPPLEVTVAEELIAFASKQEMLAKSKQFWNPDKTQFWIDSGVPLVIDRREGYFIYDVEGKRLIDVHLNGGTYNLGHRNPEVVAAGWLTEDGFAHMSTFGGAELGCVAALKTLEITCRPEVRSMVHYIAAIFTEGLARIQASYPDWFAGIRQDGLVMGLEFGHPQGATYVMKRLYENGVWAIFSTLDPRALQYKPGILLTPALCEELLERTEVAIGKARDDVAGGPAR